MTILALRLNLNNYHKKTQDNLRYVEYTAIGEKTQENAVLTDNEGVGQKRVSDLTSLAAVGSETYFNINI
jgi:hypothetical protein